jgi:carbon storage regulator
MLVLSRKVGEKIFVGENIYITVVEVQGNRVRIGIEAPKDVPIYRAELLEQKREAEFPPK